MQTTTQTTITATTAESALPHGLDHANLTAEEIDLANKVMGATNNQPDTDTKQSTPSEVREGAFASHGIPSTPTTTETPTMKVTGIAVETTTTEGNFFSRHRKALLIGTGTVAGIAGLYLIGAHTAAGQKTVEFLATKAKMAMGAVGSLLSTGDSATGPADAEASSEGLEAPAIQEPGSLNPADVANPAGDAQEIATEAAQTLGEGSEEALAAQDVANSYK